MFSPESTQCNLQSQSMLVLLSIVVTSIFQATSETDFARLWLLSMFLMFRSSKAITLKRSTSSRLTLLMKSGLQLAILAGILSTIF